jgi:hypothetical protein
MNQKKKLKILFLKIKAKPFGVIRDTEDIMESIMDMDTDMGIMDGDITKILKKIKNLKKEKYLTQVPVKKVIGKKENSKRCKIFSIKLFQNKLTKESKH